MYTKHKQYAFDVFASKSDERMIPLTACVSLSLTLRHEAESKRAREEEREKLNRQAGVLRMRAQTQHCQQRLLSDLGSNFYLPLLHLFYHYLFSSFQLTQGLLFCLF